MRITTVPTETRRTRTITPIDTKAVEVCTAFADNGAFGDTEYEQALASTTAWIDAGCPADVVPENVLAWTDATGSTAE